MNPTSRILRLSVKFRGIEETRRRRRIAAAVAMGGLKLSFLTMRVLVRAPAYERALCEAAH